jgi:splicing factor 1
METESGAKIAIRGKGSVKEGKGRSDAAHSSNQEEDLHCLIMADTEEKVNKAKKLIHNVIETVSLHRAMNLNTRLGHESLTLQQAASIPEGQNELKRNQLRELAALNGTLRDDENQACQNCGQIGHRKYDCPEKQNYTANIICRVCGNAGHMARDCPDRQKGASWRNDGARGPPRIGAGDAADREYEVCFLSFNQYCQSLADQLNLVTHARTWWRLGRSTCAYRSRSWVIWQWRRRRRRWRCETLATRPYWCSRSLAIAQ